MSSRPTSPGRPRTVSLALPAEIGTNGRQIGSDRPSGTSGLPTLTYLPVMGVNDQASAGNQQPAAELARLSEEYFDVAHRADPFGATQVGASGFDALVPAPSRGGAGHDAQQIAGVEEQLSRIDVSELDQGGRVNYAVMAHLAWAARSDLEHGLWGANASAAGYASPQALEFRGGPTALLDSTGPVDNYLRRLRGLGGYFDAVTQRYAEANRD